jgi:hypothetical protein
MRQSSMKLTDEQRAVIVENDPVACKNIRQLMERVIRKEISAERAARLRSNIEGHAIRAWVKTARIPIPIAVGLLTASTGLEPQ